MNSFYVFMVIFVIFILFICIQIYFYKKNIDTNTQKINKIESFQNTLEHINKKNNNYILDDKSLNVLLQDYNEIVSNK